MRIRSILRYVLLIPSPLQAQNLAVSKSDLASANIASNITLAVDVLILATVALVAFFLIRSGWSLKSALSETISATIYKGDTSDDGRLLVTMVPSSSRVTAAIGTLLFTLLGGHCVALIVGSTVAGTKIDVGNTSNLFLAFAGTFAPYGANKISSAIAGTTKPSIASDWKVLSPSSGGFEVGRTTAGSPKGQSDRS